MNREVRRRLDMGEKVQAFCVAHPSSIPGYAAVLRDLEDSLGRAEAIAGRQQEGLAAARSARARRAELRRVLHFQLVRYLVAVGEVVAKDRVELAERFKLPRGNANNREFATLVRNLIKVAEPQLELLVAKGMSPTLLDELTKMVAEFDAVSSAAVRGRSDHMDATVEFAGVTVNLLESVRLLDGINRYRFGGDPVVMAEWNAAKHVAGSSRAGTSRGPEGPGAGEPEGPGGIAPAA